MTREEAIERLKNYTQYRCGGVDLVAINMAIQALKQEPCDDAVSRQALLEFFKDDDYVVNEINNMPSVLPKREQGEWCEQNDDYFDWYECSECGYGSEGEMQYSSEHDVRTKYCPNCGAEMR